MSYFYFADTLSGSNKEQIAQLGRISSFKLIEVLILGLLTDFFRMGAAVDGFLTTDFAD